MVISLGGPLESLFLEMSVNVVSVMVMQMSATLTLKLSLRERVRIQLENTLVEVFASTVVITLTVSTVRSVCQA